MTSSAVTNPTILFGTCQPDRDYYAGRTHIVWPSGQLPVGLCRLPVNNLWEIRPPQPSRLCPECCLLAIARLFPAFGVLPKRGYDDVIGCSS